MDKGFQIKYIFPILIFVSIILLSIGYAQVNNVNLEITGMLSSIVPDSLYIVDAKISGSSNEGDEINSIVSSYAQTVVSSSVVLSSTKIDSTVSMDVTMHNYSKDTYIFNDIVYNDEFYSNNNIDYYLLGLSSGYQINPDDEITFTVIFKYSDLYKNSNPKTPYNNVLDSTLNFMFVNSNAYLVTTTGLPFELPKSKTFANKGETYTLDLQKQDYYLKVNMNNNRTNDFTYLNNILSIPNVNGNINIEVIDASGINIKADEYTPYIAFSNPASNLNNFNKLSFNGKNFSDKTITKIVVEVTYNYSSGGNNQYSNCVLNYNGTTTQKLSYTTGSNVVKSVTFTKQIPPGATFTISNTTGKTSNGAINFLEEKIYIYY